jgi:hypothetical protein
VGDAVTLGDRHEWTVKAVTEHFAALTRPVTDADREQRREEYDEAHGDDDVDQYEELEGDVFYTVLDWENGYRGPCNLIGQAWGDGTYSETECAAMLAEFESGRLEVSQRSWVRIEFADAEAAR